MSEFPPPPSPATPRSFHGHFPRPFSGRALAIGAAAMALALVILPHASRAYYYSYKVLTAINSLDEVFSTLRQIPTGTGVFLLIASVLIIEGRRARQAVAYLVLALALGFVVNEPIKQITGRLRPEFSIERHPGEDGDRFQRFLRANPGTPVRPERGDQWLLLRPGRPWFEAMFTSFPSGHAVAVFTLAAWLGAVYRRGRWLWLLAAVGCALARVKMRRHFLDDVLFGAGLGWALSHWVLSWKWPARTVARAD